MRERHLPRINRSETTSAQPPVPPIQSRRLRIIAGSLVVPAVATLLLSLVLLPGPNRPISVASTARLRGATARGPIPGLAPCSAYAVYYGSPSADVLAALKAFDLVILHPDSGLTTTQVADLQADGTIVLCYVSVGEEPPITPRTGDTLGPVYYAPGENCQGVADRHCGNGGFASYYLDEITNTTGTPGHDGIPDIHSTWNSHYADPASPTWREMIRLCGTKSYTPCTEFHGSDYAIDTLGCDGLFLDTVDTASPWHYYSYTLHAMTDCISSIASWYPNKLVVLNRGIFFADAGFGADAVRPSINGIIFEGYCSEWDWAEDEGRDSPWFENNRDEWAPKLNAQAALTDGYTVFALDYFTPSQRISIAHQISETVERWGWPEYISTPTLDSVRWEVWTYCSRRVWLPLVLRADQ